MLYIDLSGSPPCDTETNALNGHGINIADVLSGCAGCAGYLLAHRARTWRRVIVRAER